MQNDSIFQFVCCENKNLFLYLNLNEKRREETNQEKNANLLTNGNIHTKINSNEVCFRFVRTVCAKAKEEERARMAKVKIEKSQWNCIFFNSN